MWTSYMESPYRKSCRYANASGAGERFRNFQLTSSELFCLACIILAAIQPKLPHSCPGYSGTKYQKQQNQQANKNLVKRAENLTTLKLLF